jgi:hypothetical protein
LNKGHFFESQEIVNSFEFGRSLAHPWKCVHGSLHGVAGEALDAVEGVGHKLCPLGQAVQDRVSLKTRKIIIEIIFSLFDFLQT